MARLLWRGSLQLHNDYDYDDAVLHPAAGIASLSSSSAIQQQLHGLAIVASSFTLSTSSQQHDPDDPFSSSSSPFKIDTTAELCLDIEMLRNGPLYIEERRARVKIASLDGEGEEDLPVENDSKPHGRKALKKSIEMLRKGKQKSSSSSPTVSEVVFIDSEQDSNLSLYIDQRCHETVRYFNNFFCKTPVNEHTGRTTFGLALALDKEDELGISSGNAQRKVVVYGQIAPGPYSSRPILHLHVAKYRNKRQTGARPDAPAPRENLFAQKLRRTVSQPNMTLKGAPKSKLSATNGKATLHPSGPLSATTLSTQQTARARNLFGKPQVIHSAKAKGAPSDKASLMQAPLIHGSPGRRGQKRPRLTAGGLRALEEVTEHDADMLSDGLGGGDDDIEHVLSIKKMRNDRDGSPTPSVATNRSFASTHNGGYMKAPKARTKAGGAASLMKRSMSMPPGRLDFGAGLKGSSKLDAVRTTREVSLAPTDITTTNIADENGNSSSSMETRNKGTIRKVLLAAMVARSCGREHEDFKEVFSVAYKGLQCAFRHQINVAKLDKEVVAEMTERHLSMYL
ncbi:hypothetical protein P389DRAFT_208587 [Cystobasidium minutum MCA 4210]|uniref:uncharacterized protein n=1 Tax=Cystobasidium minutum MCA 4210 TaxID=1397322 RepID=UPI0034CD9FD0|eukprot:jgi/Rhomi1/208587/estExt_Genemark1.C_2_t10285